MKTPLTFHDPKLPTAAALLAEIRERGGRVYRYREERVACLTDDPEVARWLCSLGAHGYGMAALGSRYQPGAYTYTRGGKIGHDLWIERIPVEGSLWEAAA